ncbi:MAG TPA: LacI family DNA-binding transcriptional regulator [Terracidiphilus sp.]|jgi:LacI family transcriptional regulator
MKPPNIKDIAKALGISIGTVDRALHGRSDVSAATRDRVLKKAAQLGYQPNIAARSLKLNRRLRIGVYFPREIASFFDPLRSGVRAAATASMGVNVELVFRTFPRLDEGDLELLTADAEQKFDGVLITPGNPNRIEAALRKLALRGTPVVCVASDAPRSLRLASVTADAHTSGAIAAELFSRTIHKTGQLATITGDLTTLDHAEKLRGFAANLAILAPNLSLLPALESHEQPRVAYKQAMALLTRKPHPLGIYISTANSIPILEALEERNFLGEIQVIATDLFSELVPYIESGKILATLYQRPFVQGKTAFELLLHYILNGVTPEPLTRLAPHIILRSNLPLFIGYLAEPPDTNA